ncbi:MAG TPA: hypothetical protein VFG69_06465 [Nannocystaceae bacterium]|nr:hypothetical protein [Nannocystaceae bacterium]
MLRRLAVGSSILFALTLNAGCWLLPSYDTPVIEGEDVSIDTPNEDGFRGSGVRGEVYQLALDTAYDTNDWVAETVSGMADITRTLNGYPEDRRDGEWRVYGPHDDEDGRDISWMVKIKGDSAGGSMEIYLGGRGEKEAALDAVLIGDVATDDSARNGGFVIDFDAINANPALLEDEDYEATVTGRVNVEFARDLDSDYKWVDIAFEDVDVTEDDTTYDFDGEAYEYHRDAKGSGTFHLGARGSFEEGGWSGPEIERMTIDMRWTAEADGRARGQILESEDQGDLRYGDIVLHECFASDGQLTWRSLTEAYAAVEEPDYDFGSEKSCVFGEDELEGPATRD